MSIEAIALVVTLVTAGVFALLGLLHASKQTLNIEDYMVSRNQFGSGMTFATLVASAMGVWILFSPPEVGATSGIAGIVGYCIGSAAPPALFARVGPRMRRLMPHGHSLNEFVLYRFGNVMYALTLAIIVFYMFIYLTAELTAIAKAVQILAAVPLGWTALIVITATFIYTSYGGLSATIFTDVVQFFIIVPLLLISFAIAVVALGGFAAALQPVQLQAPELLSFSNFDAIKFGLTLIVAIIAAETFNQSNWQRVYACRSHSAVKRAFLGSAIAIFPMILIAGSLGLLARHFGFDDDRAFFSLLQQLSPPLWVIMGVLVLALALVMSTIASLLNGIASVFTIDLMRLFPQIQPKGLLRASRILTVLVGMPAIAIAAQGYDVLYLFLLADLVCAGAIFPVLYGLYSRRLTGTGATWSAAIAIAAGALFFPKPDYSPWLNLPGGGDLLVSFIVPVIISIVIIGISNVLTALNNRSQEFDFDQLQARGRSYTNSAAEAPALTSESR
jgi:Na+/proline symporter